jgi:hypothetical protein
MAGDCDRLGLTPDERAALTGFSSRAVAALAHLREAWCIADETNRPGVEAAITSLLCTRSLRERPGICAAVLGEGLDNPRALLDVVGSSLKAEPAASRVTKGVTRTGGVTPDGGLSG